MKRLLFGLLALMASALASISAYAGPTERSTTTGIPTFAEVVRRPLSLAEAINIAAAQNAVILAAQKDVEARYGIAIQVRSIVLPKVIESAAYQVSQDSLIEANQAENRELPSFRILI